MVVRRGLGKWMKNLDHPQLVNNFVLETSMFQDGIQSEIQLLEIMAHTLGSKTNPAYTCVEVKRRYKL